MSSGTLGFYSYRDPNVETTLNAYDACANWMLSHNFSEQDIDEAKVYIYLILSTQASLSVRIDAQLIPPLSLHS